MADDAGALLVRSGLVPHTALDDARIRVANIGGTIGEQLVAANVITDDALTDFYRSRLLVPQVNPNTLARLPNKVVSTIPSDMAIELRAIPVSLDNDNNLTVAMSDPSDSHAVDEIAFFTGTYVVRAVATQMQIAWCLAHYYGHITALGQRLLQPTMAEPEPAPPPEPRSSAPSLPRAKGLTAQVERTRHRAIAPITGPVDIVRPTSGELDLVKLTAQSPIPDPTSDFATTQKIPPVAASPRANRVSPDPNDFATTQRMPSQRDEAPLRAASAPELADDAAPDRPRARSVSGEIRVPRQRAASIKPPVPEPHLADGEEDDGPVITMVAGDPSEDATGPRMVPLPRKKQQPNPPELAERGGEIEIAARPLKAVVMDEARIIIEDEPPIDAHVSGELRGTKHREVAAAPATTIEISDETSAGVVIHEHYTRDSEPVLLDRKRPSEPPTNRMQAVREPDTEEDVVELPRKLKPSPLPRRTEKRTQVGIGALPAMTRTHRDTEAGGVPSLVDDQPTEATAGDDTRVDGQAVSPAPDDITDETIAPPAPRGLFDDTNPRAKPAPRASQPIAWRASTNDDDADDAPFTAVMSAVELDEAIPERHSDLTPAHLTSTERNRKIDYDPVDDGWGPPGTTIPPPLLGAVPGSDDDDGPGRIPVSDLDAQPLIIAPPSPPRDGGKGLVRELEDATSRSIQLINSLERAQTRDEVVHLMIKHLADSHRRTGFFSIKSGELGVFSMHPRPELIPVTTLRLDRPSTLQDVVGTRLPYRGPMHDDASRNFLAAILGATPPEILLVPVAIRERVVGVLYGEFRHRHTFDDQLALAARAAGMALERILKAKPR